MTGLHHNKSTEKTEGQQCKKTLYVNGIQGWCVTRCSGAQASRKCAHLLATQELVGDRSLREEASWGFHVLEVNFINFYFCQSGSKI